MRVRNNSAVTVDTVFYVGVGDIFAIAGQSNAVGHGWVNSVYSHLTLKAALFGNDYAWKNLTDPTDINTNQVDAVSSDLGTYGSLWPIVVDSIMSNFGIPVGIIPNALGGASISQWQPSTNHKDRTTLYGSMITRIDTVGGVKVVLWWQGETEAWLCWEQSAYNSAFDIIADAIKDDADAKIMPCLLQNSETRIDSCEAKIRAAIVEAWGDNPNVLEGPDFSDLESDDGAHLQSVAKIDSAANRFWRKIRDNIYEAP